MITIIYGCGSMLTEPPQFGPLGGEPLGYYHCPTDDGFARLVAVPDLWKDLNSMKEFIVAATLVYRDTTLFNTKITWTGIPETVATAHASTIYAPLWCGAEWQPQKPGSAQDTRLHM